MADKWTFLRGKHDGFARCFLRFFTLDRLRSLRWQFPNQRPAGDLDQQIFSRMPVHPFAHARLACLGDEPRRVILRDEIVQVVVGLQNDIAAASAVAAAGPALGDEGFAMERDAALAAMTCTGKYFDLVYEHADLINSQCTKVNTPRRIVNDRLPGSAFNAYAVCQCHTSRRNGECRCRKIRKRSRRPCSTRTRRISWRASSSRNAGTSSLPIGWSARALRCPSGISRNEIRKSAWKDNNQRRGNLKGEVRRESGLPSQREYFTFHDHRNFHCSSFVQIRVIRVSKRNEIRHLQRNFPGLETRGCHGLRRQRGLRRH